MATTATIYSVSLVDRAIVALASDFAKRQVHHIKGRHSLK
jgi:hypothetical protein